MTSPYRDAEDGQTRHVDTSSPRASFDSLSSSDTSIALERLDTEGIALVNGHSYKSEDLTNGIDEERATRSIGRRHRRRTGSRGKCLTWTFGLVCLGGWVLALLLFLSRKSYKHPSSKPFDPSATTSKGSGKAVTLDQVLSGAWSAQKHAISWITGPNNEDGFLLERGGGASDKYLYIEDIRARKPNTPAGPSVTLMKSRTFKVDSEEMEADDVWPSRDQKKVLVVSDKKKNWRHSFTGRYWILDVASQNVEALDPGNPDERIQLATWSPRSNAVVFTRKNNMFIRHLDSKKISQVTTDGGPDIFYGVPDWVYEEEVFAGNSVTWWSEDGDFIAFLRTNDTLVPEYPVQYFVSRPSQTEPAPGRENYPEVRQLKYPKAGAPNPVAELQFFDVKKGDVFTVKTDDFPDDDRLVTEVVWAGDSGQVIVKNTNRESDVLKVALIDVKNRQSIIVRVRDMKSVDGGWFEVSEKTTFVPSDPKNGRPHDGYIDTVIYKGFDHLAYFTPLNSSDPIMLTSGEWEVVDAPSAIDLVANVVYFVGTKESSLQRHVYSVNMDGTGIQHISKADDEGYYEVSFSTGAGFALLSYLGPGVPWQEVRSTPTFKGHLWQYRIESNDALAKMAAETELPIKTYSTITVDGLELNVLERRPPQFNANRQYPVLFQLYGGPNSQQVDKRFVVDFQSYVASKLGYVVVTVDGRGTGFIGRKARTIIRGHIGYYEGLDQIQTAKIWAAKPYIDEDRMAIWGWSYGGFMALKTLELDGGETFKYGVAVAPVTDWNFYDSIYTERYMQTPQHNPDGYQNTSITDVDRLAQNTRFLIMHGVADDNVHLQNTLTLLDKLDLAGIENYDVHIFPDSDHNIMFHNAYRMV